MAYRKGKRALLLVFLGALPPAFSITILSPHQLACRNALVANADGTEKGASLRRGRSPIEKTLAPEFHFMDDMIHQGITGKDGKRISFGDGKSLSVSDELAAALAKRSVNEFGSSFESDRARPELVEALTQKFKDYIFERKKPLEGTIPAVDGIFYGNRGHIQDHYDFIEANYSSLKALGADIPSLKLLVAVHDIGKSLKDAQIDAEVKAAMDREGMDGKDRFLSGEMFPHEHHSLAVIPKVVREVLLEMGIERDHPKFQEFVNEISQQLQEGIRMHNAVWTDHNFSTAEFPNLSEAERKSVANSWWMREYQEKFVERLHLGEPYGHPDPEARPDGLSQKLLNFIDRATLTGPNAPIKLGLQEMNGYGFTKSWLERVFVEPANDNIPLIKANAQKISPQNPEGLPFVKSAIAQAEKLQKLGVLIHSINDPMTLPSELKLSKGELPYESLNQVKTRNGLEVDPNTIPQYLYYKTQETGLWQRVVLQNKVGRAEVFKDGSWQALSVKSKSAPEILNELIVKDGRW